MELARKYDISIKEVEETILRSFLIEWHGFKCEHPEDKIIIRKDRGKPHCKWCWTFVQILERPEIITNVVGFETKKGKLRFRPIKNPFEDEIRAKLKGQRETFDKESGK